MDPGSSVAVKYVPAEGQFLYYNVTLPKCFTLMFQPYKIIKMFHDVGRGSNPLRILIFGTEQSGTRGREKRISW